ncbi:hypothetical protein IEQ34_014530 [Dendrobium chrysotoxum]|uniref:Uncharacterized protein n=1 Tax=Dendrobium chrysotoxum TaxID=161865 RepID=A0AAV7GLX5_DENCH|nr:hypothetical protein IEQ34_014530 [Dendrobium chrysotoxum]
MGISPYCDENGLKNGLWTPKEDQKLVHYIQNHCHGTWRALSCGVLIHRVSSKNLSIQVWKFSRLKLSTGLSWVLQHMELIGFRPTETTYGLAMEIAITFFYFIFGHFRIG